MEAKPTGKYAALFFNAVHTSVLPVLKRETLAIAQDIRKDVIRRIRRQVGLKDPVLSTQYLKRKIRLGLDWRSLIATSRYIDNIVVEETEYGARVGVRNIMHDGSPLTTKQVPMHQLAEWLEYGTTRAKIGRAGPAQGQPWYMPPRPHWRPAQAKFERELSLTRKKLTQAMENALLEAVLGEIDFDSDDSSGPAPVDPGRFQHEKESRFKGHSKVAAVNSTSRYMNKYKQYVTEDAPTDDTEE
jgi:hypothetical protein